MKKLLNKASTYAFWVGLASAIVVLVKAIGNIFGFTVDETYITELIMSICGVLVVLGFVTKEDAVNTIDKEKPNEIVKDDSDNLDNK